METIYLNLKKLLHFKNEIKIKHIWVYYKIAFYYMTKYLCKLHTLRLRKRNAEQTRHQHQIKTPPFRSRVRAIKKCKWIGQWNTFKKLPHFKQNQFITTQCLSQVSELSHNYKRFLLQKIYTFSSSKIKIPYKNVRKERIP